MIFRLLCLLPSAALFTLDDLAIWSSPPPRSSLPWRPHKELCFNWSTGAFLSIRANVRPPFSQWIPTKLNSIPTSYSTPASVSIQLPTFLGVTFDRTLSFSKHASSLKTKFFPHLKASHCISASSWGPSKESLACIKLFFGPFLLMLHLNGFFPYALTISPN